MSFGTKWLLNVVGERVASGERGQTALLALVWVQGSEGQTVAERQEDPEGTREGPGAGGHCDGQPQGLEHHELCTMSSAVPVGRVRQGH